MVLHSIDDVVKAAMNLKKPRKTAVAAAELDHVIEAVLRARKDGFAEPVLVGRKAEIKKLVEHYGAELPDEAYVDVPSNDPNEMAAETVKLVREGKADLIMKGLLNTSELLRAILNKETGLKHSKVVTQFSLVRIPGYYKLCVMNDGAIIPYPSLEQKTEQIREVAKTMRNLGYDEDIKVAVLCGGEAVNPKIPESVDAAELKKLCESGAFPGCVVEGPMQLDSALDTEAARIKGASSPVAGNADVLIFPNMVSGNLTNKMTVFTGGTSVGMVIGAGVPISLTSRAATSEQKYLSLAMAAASVRLEGEA